MKKTKDAIWPGETIEIEATATSETAVLQVISGELTADKAITLLKKEFGGLVIDCSTPAGFDDAMKTRTLLVKMRTGADKKRKELDAPDQEKIKARMAAYKLLEPVLLQLEAPFDAQIKKQQDIDKENARIAAEKEAARKLDISNRIKRIEGMPLSYLNLSATDLDAKITQIDAAPISEAVFQEFLQEAVDAKDVALVTLREMLVTKKEQGAETERLRIANEKAAALLGRQRMIATIRDWPRLVFGKSSAEIETALAGYLDVEFESSGELQEEFDAAREKSISEVMSIMETTKQREDDAVELAKLRASQPEVKTEPVKGPLTGTGAAEPLGIFTTTLSATAEPAKQLTQEPAKVEPVATSLDGKPIDPEFFPFSAEPVKVDPRETEPVTISRAEYERLQDRDYLLSCLEEWGVDNWSGYDEAMHLYRTGDGHP